MNAIPIPDGTEDRDLRVLRYAHALVLTIQQMQASLANIEALLRDGLSRDIQTHIEEEVLPKKPTKGRFNA